MGLDNLGLIDIAAGWVTAAGNAVTKDAHFQSVVLAQPLTVGHGGRLTVENGATLFDGAGGIISKDADDGGVLSVAPAGTLTVLAGGRLTVEPKSHLTASPTALVAVYGALFAGADNLGSLFVGNTGKLDIQGHVTASAATVTVAKEGTIELDPAPGGQPGELADAGSASIAGASLVLNYGDNTQPGCGVSVVALTAPKVTSAFGSVQATPPPPAGTWEPQVTPTTAGGLLVCPP